jgi:predicted ATP-grasp superfamily ATP-dependent carboligase
MTPSRPPAVILGGSYNAVSVARSLGRSGVEISALGDPMSAVRHSRYCTRFANLGSGSGVQARWLEWLDGGPLGAVLLPCDDDGLELIARNRARLLERGYRPFEADDEVVLAMLDKDRTYALAREFGVAAPLTAAVRAESDLEAVIDSFPCPCALKPIHSHRFYHAFGRPLKAFPIRDQDELELRLRELIALGVEMLVTEIIPGAEDEFAGYYTYIDADGEPLFHLTKRKLRQYPPVFGMGCYHVTTSDPEVVDVGLRFLRGVGVRGLANVELKRDARDGRLKLIECNHRFTAPTELLRTAGVDLALFTYNCLTGRPLPSVDGYRSGVRLWLPGKDARASALLRRRGELSLGGWVRSIAHRQHTPLFDWRDPKPTIVSGLAQLGRLPRISRARRATARRSAPRPAQPDREFDTW